MFQIRSEVIGTASTYSCSFCIGIVYWQKKFGPKRKSGKFLIIVAMSINYVFPRRLTYLMHLLNTFDTMFHDVSDEKRGSAVQRKSKHG